MDKSLWSLEPFLLLKFQIKLWHIVQKVPLENFLLKLESLIKNIGYDNLTTCLVVYLCTLQSRYHKSDNLDIGVYRIHHLSILVDTTIGRNYQLVILWHSTFDSSSRWKEWKSYCTLEHFHQLLCSFRRHRMEDNNIPYHHLDAGWQIHWLKWLLFLPHLTFFIKLSIFLIN